MSKYLYGAAVQGIQSFIFQSNKLREIVGASEIVEKICTDFFNEIEPNNAGRIQQAAGKILYLFEGDDAKERCQKVVYEFPYKVMNFAPGITISQAVVDMSKCEFDTFAKSVNEIERRLKVQRNIPINSVTTGLMGIERSHTTGLPVCHLTTPDKNDHIDYGTWHKLYYKNNKDNVVQQQTTKRLCEKAFGLKDITKFIAYDIEEITLKNDWIAIIHADGNGMGQVVQKVGKDKDEFHNFSVALDEATNIAAINAFNKIKALFGDSPAKYPIRPIVLSGDDHTLICRGDLAIPYTMAFLEEFEKQTKNKVGDILTNKNVFPDGDVHDCLTACAGIAFVKSSFPFYYGYNLAEALCSQAKKDAKDSDIIRNGSALPASCLMFYKVQDSFGSDLKRMIERELRPNNSGLDYGPYYLQNKDGRMTIESLLNNAKRLGESKEGNAVKSGLRQWISLLFEDEEKAYQRLERLKAIAPSGYQDIISTATTSNPRTSNNKVRNHYPAYDMLVINTINHLKTK